jgi:predicted dienelactone hydrolase
MAAIRTHCSRAPEFICKALAHAGSPLTRSPEGTGSFVADPRIRAAVIVAPGLGFTFAGGGLADVRVPVQVWSGDRDETVPFASNTAVVLAGLGDRAEAHRVEDAAHLSFLAPCGLLQPPAICRDRDGFDREAVHASMNAAVIRFFDTHMPAR